MQKNIQYRGLSTEPSDNSSEDGAAAFMFNLIPEDGAIKPILPPGDLDQFGESIRVVYLHRSSKFEYYILLDTKDKKLYASADGDERDFLQLYELGNTELYQVTAIGNTLVALTSKGKLYWLYKNPTAGYIFLGNDFPELTLSFGLEGEMIRKKEAFEVHFDDTGVHLMEKNGVVVSEEKALGQNGHITPFFVNVDKTNFSEFYTFDKFSDASAQRISEQVLAQVNKFIAEESTQKGKFIFPFFVRYAYRLYDGSLTHHSAPVLMVCTTACSPIVLWEEIWKHKGLMLTSVVDSARLRVLGLVHSLDYAALYQSEIDALKNWGDIIKSVDIFISKPIYTYDQNGVCDKFYSAYENFTLEWGHTVSKSKASIRYNVSGSPHYEYIDIKKLYNQSFFSNLDNPLKEGILGLPRKSRDEINDAIANTANFYFLKRIKIEQLSTAREHIEIKSDYLQSLTNREVMTDDYDSHDKLLAEYAFPYNARLNLANLSKQLFTGFNPSTLRTYTDENFIADNGIEVREEPIDREVSIFIYIRDGAKDIVVCETETITAGETYVPWIFYPNTNAYKAIVYFDESRVNPSLYGKWAIEFKLEPHPLLNGAYAVNIHNTTSLAGGGYAEDIFNKQHVSSYSERTILIKNKIYTSEVNNPFLFPLLGINTIGTGKIIGVSTAAKALSEGQFGQFPLYAFTTDGVWALEVSSKGTYSARQPITRDICINPKSITQIDSAVLFITNRGIMLLEGSQSMCISDILNGDNVFNLKLLPKADKIAAYINNASVTVNIVPFKEFFPKARMIYDYNHQRIILYNPDETLHCSYAYVYSLKTKMWGMMQSDIIDSVPSYPNAYALHKGGAFDDYTKDGDFVNRNIFISRPLTLDEIYIHKTIDTFIQRGFFRSSKAIEGTGLVLYASNDLFNWIIVWSSTTHYMRGFHGTPYKYFRIAVLSQLSPDECLTGATVQFTPRLTNQPR